MWMVTNGRWAGSSMYGGEQRTKDGTQILTATYRRTEWLVGETPTATTFSNSVPAEKVAYHRKELLLNLSDYWYNSNVPGFSLTGFDSLVFPVGLTAVDTVSPVYYTSGERKKSATGFSNFNTRKTHYFRFAYGIGNPFYQLFNPQLGDIDYRPVLFGEMSDVMCVYLERKNGEYLEISVKIGHSESRVR
jgi:hypothetical protein